MTGIRADHTVEGQAVLLLDAVAAGGWLQHVPVRLVTFADVGLPADSSDRTVRRFAQTEGMLLLTDNRNMDLDVERYVGGCRVFIP